MSRNTFVQYWTQMWPCHALLPIRPNSTLKMFKFTGRSLGEVTLTPMTWTKTHSFFTRMTHLCLRSTEEKPSSLEIKTKETAPSWSKVSRRMNQISMWELLQRATSTVFTWSLSPFLCLVRIPVKHLHARVKWHWIHTSHVSPAWPGLRQDTLGPGITFLFLYHLIHIYIIIISVITKKVLRGKKNGTIMKTVTYFFFFK